MKGLIIAITSAILLVIGCTPMPASIPEPPTSSPKPPTPTSSPKSPTPASTSEAATLPPVSGNEILLGTLRSGSPWQVYLVNPDGSGESNKKLPWTFVNKPAWAPDKPVWSPNGQWAAFTEQSMDEAAGHDVSNMYIAEADGSQPQRFSYQEDSYYDPSWSPDGTHIVYNTYPDRGIYIVDITCILDGASCNFSPTYIAQGYSSILSPDGKQIAFVWHCDGNCYDSIHVISAGGAGASRKFSPSHLSCSSPQWSPDSAEIIFTCYQPICCSEGEDGIYKIKANGTELKMIADIPQARIPQWSPDGSKIAFTSFHDDDLGKELGIFDVTDALYVMNADGTEITRLSLRSDEHVLWFTWLPVSLRK